ncbi:MAG: glycosyltransferase [Saprospirales bacterium]|nr:glycosyltransferase [Saprospirales bacterium]
MKKIVLLGPAHPLRGGIASSNERLALELQQEGFEVIIYSFSLQYPSILFPGKTQYTDDSPPEGLKIRSILNSVWPLNWWKVGRALRREAPDLIIVRFWIPFMGPCLGSVLRIARRGKKGKVICISDNIIPHEKRPFDRLFTRYFIRAVDAFIVMSRSVGEELRQFSRTLPFKYVPHPVYDNYGPPVSREESLAHFGLPTDRHYLLFFGFIREYKGLDILLHALADPRLKGMPLHLLVAGEFYAEEGRYRQLIADLGLEKQLTLHDRYIPQTDVRYYFGAADLVVQPYRSATQSGISQLAYHFGKPMVVTNVGGLPEIVDHGQSGYVVEVSPEAVAEAIRDYFAEGRQAIFEEGVRKAKFRFSWANMVQTIRELVYIL